MGEKLAPLVLAEHGGRTALRLTLLFLSKEARDAALSFGAAPNFDRRDEVLASALAR